MVKKLSYNYLLDTDKKLLYKIEKERNLLWSKGGFPAINKKVIDDNKDSFDWIGVKTEKRKFTISKEFALKNCEVIQFDGYELQLFISPFFWSEEKLNATKTEANKK